MFQSSYVYIRKTGQAPGSDVLYGSNSLGICVEGRLVTIFAELFLTLISGIGEDFSSFLGCNKHVHW